MLNDITLNCGSSREAVEEYHLSRTMFAVKDNILHLHKKQTIMSHIEWFKSLGWITESNESEVISTVLRGYVSGYGVYFYKGYDGDVSSQDISIFMSHLHELCSYIKLDGMLPIYAGVNIGIPGEIYKPRKFLGKIGDHIKLEI